MISIGNLQINKLFLGNLEVAKAYLGDVEVYGSTPQPVEKYMTMTVLDGEAGTTIAPTLNGSFSTKPNLQYRVNNGSWSDFVFGTTSAITAQTGDTVQWKGVNESGISNSNSNYLKFAVSGNPISLSGNIMSLIDGVGDAIVVPCDYCFYKMFSKSNVKIVSQDFLPATTLTYSCYNDLFSESLLENSPELPATTLAQYCYQGMFYGCQNFTQAPELHATTLAGYCYQGMFQNCTSLVNPPELPTMNLKDHCYYLMFYGCTSLTTAPALPATTLANYCYDSMFYGCTALVNAPELPATTLANNCYYCMFKNCNNLNYVKCLATDITATDALKDWLANVARTGTFVKPAGVTYPSGTSGIPVGWTVVEEKPKPEGKYMTITVDDAAAGETTISPTVTGSLTPNLQYRINNGSWTDFVFGTTADIHLTADDWVQFKGNNPNGISGGYDNYFNFDISGNTVSLSGNVMSLIDGVGDALEIPNDFCFYALFRNSVIKNVSSDFLPATTLANKCYTNMFSRCTSLVNAPALPATTLADGCYNGMFYGCTSLTTAPALPATTIAYSCYRSMFEGCTSLVNAPALPATTLANMCYAEMFYKCTSLATAPVLHATKLADGCYRDMFNGCTSLTTAPELPATTIAGSCYEMMFQGCSSLVDAPALPATKLADRCYADMFNGCTSLTTAPELPATILNTWCYYSMFSGCTSLVNVPKILPATTLYDYCYSSMFYECTSLATSPELPATKLANDCYSSMFSGCTSLTTAPVLPATKLAGSCYIDMFYRCNNLNYIKCLATDITATDALKNWLYKVSVSGTFVKKYGVSYPTGISGIPQGWTVEEIDVPTPPEPEGKYMNITVLDGNKGETTIKPTVTGSLPNLNLQYRINNGDWNDFIVGTTADIHVVVGDFVQWKGNNTGGVSTSENDYLNFVISGNNVALSGNVMSLIDGVGDALEIPCNYCFYKLFESSQVKTVSSDFIHATTLKNYCYYDMFYDCTALVNAPVLPATTIAESCYRYMFSGCSSLVTAPELPATNLAVGCYQGMFNRCSNLIQAPALPATILKDSCYKDMFGECTSLTTAPDLLATKLVDYCYNFMFANCRKLNYIKSFAVEGLNSFNALRGWLSLVSNTGTFVKPAGVSYETGASGIPSGWTIQNI